MIRPDFFVVGAPKSGTTAICDYLRAHPHVFMSDPKEPAFFATDMPNLCYLGPHGDYAALFEGATAQHFAVGEGSTCYLYSRVAVAKIQEFNPQARIIAVLRNPIDATPSFHAQLCYDTDEDQDDFATAWRLQSRRCEGQAIPRHCRAPARLQYRQVFLLGEHVERILRCFPRTQVKLILFDDFARSPAAAYSDLLAFLGVPGDNRRDFPRVNPGKTHHARWLARLIMQPPPILQRPVDAIKRRLGLESLGLGRALIRWNRRAVSRLPIGTELREELTAAFREDILKLARVLGRDLSHWLAPAEGSTARPGATPSAELPAPDADLS